MKEIKRRLRSFFDGDYPLAAMFWGYLIFNLITTPKGLYLRDPVEAEAVSSLMMVVFLPVHFVWLVGLWRSANKYGGAVVWRVISQLYVIIAVIAVVYAVLAPLIGN